MVTLNRIYTRTGDGGETRLATGETTPKDNPRVEAYGDVAETNACLGLVRLHTADDPDLDAILARIQNELFEIGKRHAFANLRDWFGCLYQVLLGQQEGPRFGGFVALYGVPGTIGLVETALARPAA